MVRTRTIATLALCVGMALAGCGSGGKGDGVASLSGGTSTTVKAHRKASKQDQRDALLAYTRCLRKEGLDVPDPTFGTSGGPGGGGQANATGSGAMIATPGGSVSLPGPDDPLFKAADAKCKPILDAATQDLPQPSPKELAEARDHALAFAKCMRKHGVDMPDPTFDAQGHISIKVPGPKNGDPSSPLPQVVIDAQKACQKDSPIGGPGSMSVSSSAESSGPS